jgi:hypothetical protein
VAFLVLINISLSLMTQVSTSSHDVHHTYDAATGSALLWVRAVVGVGFVISICLTYKESRFRVRTFLPKFGVLGTLYIFFMPAMVYIANRLIPAKDRNEIVFISG